MEGQLRFLSIEGRLAEISVQGDPPETLSATVDLEMLRPVLKALARSLAGRAVAPGAVLKFRMLVLQSLHGLSLEQTEYLVRDRLSRTGRRSPGAFGLIPGEGVLISERSGRAASKGPS